MMSNCEGNAEHYKDGNGKDRRLSSPSHREDPDQKILSQELSEIRGPRCKYPRRPSPPLIAPASDCVDNDQDPENIHIPRRGPRCRYPRHETPPGKAPVNDYVVLHVPDPENIPILEDPDLLEMSEEFAEAALSYLSQQGHNLKLLSLDYYEGGTVGGGAMFHHNFQAKPANDPDAPPETFFSQMFFHRDQKTRVLKDLTAEYCVSLGPSDSLPKKRDKRGCTLCSIYIHHPKDGCSWVIC